MQIVTDEVPPKSKCHSRLTLDYELGQLHGLRPDAVEGDALELPRVLPGHVEDAEDGPALLHGLVGPTHVEPGTTPRDHPADERVGDRLALQLGRLAAPRHHGPGQLGDAGRIWKRMINCFVISIFGTG